MSDTPRRILGLDPGLQVTGYGVLEITPAGPRVAAQLGANNFVRIAWAPVTTTPIGFPARPIVIKGYQVIVGTFQVTLPSTATFVTLPPEFVASLLPGVQAFEVLAIEQHGNQTLTEGSFVH